MPLKKPVHIRTTLCFLPSVSNMQISESISTQLGVKTVIDNIPFLCHSAHGISLPLNLPYTIA